LKICILGPFYPSIGGLETMARLLAMEAGKQGHIIELVTTTAATSALDGGFPFRVTRTDSHVEMMRAFRRSDVVLFMNVSLQGMLAALPARVPIVLSHHGIYRQRKDGVGRFLELIKRQLTWLFPNIAVSRFVARNLPAKCEVIPNAYDDSLFKPPLQANRPRDFVFCARLVSDKGADLCIRAFAKASSLSPGASLTIVGEGPERPALEALADEAALEKHITFTGALTGEALVCELQRHACMVVSSLWEEPFGIAALEGIACCDTVIVTRRGALPEVVGQCGVAVEPTVDELAGAMLEVLSARRRGLRLPGQVEGSLRSRHLAQHASEKVAGRYLDVLALAAGQRTP
jgi:glycosyltransferase involved in cell wall biosynthesis